MLPSGFLSFLRATALIAVLAGALGSAGLPLYAGRHNHSRILPALFTLWVLSPFMALLVASVVSKRWSFPTRAALYTVMLFLTLGSLALYADVALGPPRAKPARFRVRRGSPSVMAADCNRCPDSRSNIWQAVASGWHK